MLRLALDQRNRHELAASRDSRASNTEQEGETFSSSPRRIL